MSNDFVFYIISFVFFITGGFLHVLRDYINNKEKYILWFKKMKDFKEILRERIKRVWSGL